MSSTTINWLQQNKRLLIISAICIALALNFWAGSRVPSLNDKATLGGDLILEDPLDHFSPKESRRLIDFLTHKDRPWALIVVSDNLYWEEHCHQAIVLEKGKIVESKSQGSC